MQRAIGHRYSQTEAARSAERKSARPEAGPSARENPYQKVERHTLPGPQDLSARNPENAAYEKALYDRNDKAMRHAADTAEVSAVGSRTDYGKIQGTLAEGLHHYSRGGAIGLVHDVNAELGNHNPVFDASSSRELTSIKTHLSEKNRNAPGSYASDLREMVGAQDSHKVDGFADKLWTMKQSGGEEWRRAETFLPSGVRGARSPAEMRAAVVDEAVLRIPTDQVEPTRQYVIRNAQRYPEVYGLDPLATPKELEVRANMLAMKIKPIADGVTSHDMRVMTRQCYQNRYGYAYRL